MAGRLAGQVIVVTGASAGIGEATALEAASAGMRVVAAARRADRLADLVQRCQDRGAQAIAVATDVARAADVQRLVDRAIERFGRLDVMLANAGLGHFAPLVEMDEATERRLWEVNYQGTMRCVRAAAAAMRRQQPDAAGRRGHIMITSSVVGRVGLPYYGVYAATKAAQHAAAASLRLELEPERIEVTGIYPGGTATEFFDVVAEGAGADALAANTPRLFVQTPQQVARKIIGCVRRPRPELWPGRLTRWGMLLWTIFPRLYTASFRLHARRCRKALDGLSAQDEPEADRNAESRRAEVE